MWFPPPVVDVFGALSSITCEDRYAMWLVFPLYGTAGFHNDPLYANDERKFLLMRSLFELVLANDYLEHIDPKLLGWFQCLTAEDKTLIQQEGGYLQFLKKHPALEVTRKYVYVKQNVRRNCVPPPTTMSSNSSRYPKFYGASQCQNCRTSCPFGSKKCSRCGVHIAISEDKVCVSENEKQLELLPNSVKEELNVLTAKSDVTKQNINSGCMQSTLNTRPRQRYDERSPDAHPPSYSKGMCPHAQCLSRLWEEVEKREDAKHFQDTTAQASFSLDMELDKQSRVQRNDYIQNDQDLLYDQMEKADDHKLDQEVMPEYYSFSSTSLDHTVWSDGSQSTEAGYNDSIMATKGSTELSDEPSDASMANATSANSTDCFSCLSNSFELADESGDRREDLQKKQDSRYEQQIEQINVVSSKCGASVSVDQIIDACGDFRACFTSTCATEVGQIFQVKNIATDTDLLAVSHEKDTQTVQMATSEKNTITEVCMSDLDVLTEEFIKLKETENELKQLRSRKASPSPGGDHCGCDCAQRVRRAELRLLALQFVMCQQHCWRRYFTSPLGEIAHQGTEALPDSIAETLNTLQKDYHERRRLILAGTPLDDLKPLSVDSEKITTRGNYSPASVLEAHLDSFHSPGSTIAHGDRVDEESKEMRAPNTEVCLDTESAPDAAKGNGNKSNKEVFSHKNHGASTETTPGAIKDPNASEAWFDAEEELVSPNQDGKMEKQNEKRESKKGTDESKESSLLCITCLPLNVTEHEVLLWFEKYNATNVCISTFSNNMRAAIVYLKNPNDAKAAVEELNGRSLQGHTVQVVQLCRPALAEPILSDQSCSTSETAGDGLGTKGITYSLSHGGPRCSLDRLTNVCDSPTASGTCVPQHYATMGSFDTIMARLLERHPSVGRQRIVDALLELRAKHQGFLSGLPLRSIVDMTSELLSQASTPTCI